MTEKTLAQELHESALDNAREARSGERRAEERRELAQAALANVQAYKTLAGHNNGKPRR